MRPAALIEACQSSNQHLLDTVASLSDDDLRAPSELPQWSRAHVVAHVTNKARAHAWLFGGPPCGEVRRLHPEGHDQDHAAEVGASRPASELRGDLQESFTLLEHAWDELDDSLWDREGIMTAGPRTMAEIVSHHLRNVEVHHVDLGVGYQPWDWPAVFVDGELSKRLRALPDRADGAELLAWLLGRRAAPELGPW